MVTIVTNQMQPLLTPMELTLVSMAGGSKRSGKPLAVSEASDFAARLTEAMGTDHSRADLARYCKISRPAVSRWFTNGGIRPIHLFTVAHRLQVNAEWLGTGAGSKKPGPQCVHDDISQSRIDLIRMYGRLPKDIRFHLRTLIGSYSYLVHPRTSEYIRAQEQVNNMVHDKPKPEKVK